MLIKELRLSHDLKRLDHTITTGSDLSSIIHRNGWKILGSGIEGTVAEHPNKNYVLKLFNSNSKYSDFVNHIKDNQDNPHYPRFGRYVRQVPGTPFSYVRMEKLSNINDNQLTLQFFAELSTLYMYGKIWGKMTLGSELWGIVKNRFEDDNIDIIRNKTITSNDLLNIFRHYGNPGKPWIEVCRDLIDLGKHIGLRYLDLYAANFMLRGNTLVVADPFYD